MRRSMFALAGVAVLAAVTALVFGTLGEAAVPATAATQSFTFCSGSANASFGANGEGPTTSGLGSFGALDPVTNHDGVVTPSLAPGPAVIIQQNPGWGLVAGSRWISYGLTSFSGPPNFSGGPAPAVGLVTFTVDFFLPTGATNPILEVTTIQDDKVDIYLNGLFEVTHAGHIQASQLTHTTTGSSSFIPGANNQLRFDLKQTGGDGFGLDYCATVTFTPTPGPCVQPPSDIVAWWPLNENSGTTVADIVGGHTGTTIPAGLGVGGPAPVAGMVDGAFAFNGTTQWVEVPSAPALNFGDGNFSIDAWINLTNGSGYRPIVDKRDPGATDVPFGYQFFVEDNKLGFFINTALQPLFTSAGSAALSPDLVQGQWHHVAVTIQRGSTTGGNLYVNGVIVETFNMTPLIGVADHNSDLIIAARNIFFEPEPIIRDVFDGQIDEVEIFHRALSGSEIQAIFNAGSAGKCPPAPTPTPIPPTPTPTPGPVGGIVELPADNDTPAEASGSSSARDYTAPIAAAAGAVVVALAAGGWYARRRWLR